jgi:RHS repeat-associated protein
MLKTVKMKNNMKTHNIIQYGWLLAIFFWVFTNAIDAQSPYILPSYSAGLNYISTRTFKKPSTKETIKNIGDIVDAVQYFDGLGRLDQSIVVKNSLSENDLIQPLTYDSHGRESVKYLPYTRAGNGSFDPFAITGGNGTYSGSNHSVFYQLTEGVVHDNYPYAMSVFENSPLNRVMKQGATGNDWQPTSSVLRSTSEHVNSYEYQTNTTDEVPRWVVNMIDECEYYDNYLPGELYVIQTTDENGHSNKEYKDMEGRVILKSVNDGNTWQKTYYVYDMFNLLRFVLPPKAIQKVNGTNKDVVMDQLTYQYTYDGRNRMITKKFPGAEPVYMVYDNLDRLVLIQDGERRKDYQWLFTKYDELNRPVLTGVYTNSITTGQASMQTLVTEFYTSNTKYYETLGTDVLGYTNQSFPNVSNENDYLTVTYFDIYGSWALSFADANSINISGYSDTEGDTRYYEKLAGRVTGTRVKVLNTNVWLTTTNYYDDRYRVIQTRRDLFDDSNGGKETTCILYDFEGKTKQTKQNQTFGTVTTTVDKWFTYDHAGRLTKTEQEINGANHVVLSQMIYNEIGQLTQKKLHGGIQNVDYSYNIRGWLTQINDPEAPADDLFTMKLLYNDNSTLSGLSSEKQFNGNIAGIIWNSKDQNNNYTRRGYGFIYDAVNRLNNSDYGEGTNFTAAADQYNEYDISYDANGNINTLKRNNNTGLIDNLTYTYTNSNISNQLDNVSDASGNSNGFKDVSGSDYSYDTNGNLKKDANKSFIGIDYNFLNLPNLLTKDVNNKIGYIYDASGNKLCKMVTSGGATTNRYYAGIFEYNSNKTLSLLQTDEGLVEVTLDASNNPVFNYQYYLKDHLGNIRAMFNTSGTLIQRTDYYPFGMTSDAYCSSTDNKYLYNGKEKQNELALDWYDYGARFYDPQIGRWHSVDPNAAKFPRESPYIYCSNNPIIYIDPDGQEKIVIVGNQGSSPNSDRNNNTGYAYKEGTRHFLQAGLDQARAYKKNAGDEIVTMIIYKGQYSSKELKLYKEVAKKDGINIKVISDNADIADYVNKKKEWSLFGSTSERDKDLITDFAYIGHGNTKSMLVGYHTFLGETLEATDFNKSAFDADVNICLNSCGSALGDMYQTFLGYTNGEVKGFNVTVHWGENKNGLGIGRYMGFWLEYFAPENRNQPRKYVEKNQRVKTQNGTRDE